MNKRQLRSWVFMLYPDNPYHVKAIEKIDKMDNSLYIKHVAKYDDEGKEINKEHWHCILKFDKPYWNTKLLYDLGLDQSDEHLFHSYSDFKRGNTQIYKSLDNYVDYLDHMENDNKPDKYSIDDFKGGLVDWAASIIANREKDKVALFSELCDFIRVYNLENFPVTRNYTFADWFKLCINNGYGKIFFDNWYKMRDVLHPYLNY